jgi:hypothetical protein
VFSLLSAASHSWYLFCAGGVFKLELFLPEDYPMAPPKVARVLSAAQPVPLMAFSTQHCFLCYEPSGSLPH